MSLHVYTYVVRVVGGSTFTMYAQLPLRRGDVIIHDGRELYVEYVLHAVAQGLLPLAVVRTAPIN